MTPLTGFILVVIVITVQISLYTIKRLQEPLEPDLSPNKSAIKNQTNFRTYWINAETTNGRLAMVGLLALVINYGLFGWIIPGFI